MKNANAPKYIGGFPELYFSANDKEYYPDLIALNTARNALEFVLLGRQYTKVYMPYYTSETIFEPLKKHSIPYEFYHVNDAFEMADFPTPKKTEAVLYTNYFGLKDDCISTFVNMFDNVIVDNTQSFFSQPMPGVDTLYSIKKFCPTSDGAYVSTDLPFDPSLYAQDVSYERMMHLVKRADIGPQSAYEDFQRNSQSLEYCDIMLMSNVTKRLAKSFDYEHIAAKRRQNFAHLHAVLEQYNQLRWQWDKQQVPFVYPMLLPNGQAVKKELIRNNIFVATYWPEVRDICSPESMECQLASHAIFLPIDHRYTTDDMDHVLQILLRYI